MSYSVSGSNSIVLTRGDTLRCTIEIESNGQKYTPKSGDTIRFAMKQNYNDKRVLITKNINTDTLILYLSAEDTKNLAFGKYVYDIQLTTDTGDVDTFISGVIKLTEEVD